MKFFHSISIALCLLLLGCSAGFKSEPIEAEKEPANPFASENLFAWCVVPFDNQNRNPQERIAMLKKLGFSRYAYDWRQSHLETFSDEIDQAEEQGVEIMAVWIWIDANSDQPGKLSAGNEKILQTISNKGLSTQLWLGFNSNYFSGESESEKIATGVEMVSYLSDRASEMGCNVALYNHGGGWFGIPDNQVKIIKQLPNRDIGIVFNFHHAHEYLDRFDEIVVIMMPYLRYVNLNGMRASGPKILTIGSGDQEMRMIQELLQAGYSGPFGILGHVADRDVEEVLKENLEGLSQLEAAILEAD